MASADSKGSEWVKLISTDGFEFVVPRVVAEESPALKDMLSMDMGLAESLSNSVALDYRGSILHIVVEYLMYRHQVQTAGPRDDLPDFQERIPPELSLEVLMAADFLQT